MHYHYIEVLLIVRCNYNVFRILNYNVFVIFELQGVFFHWYPPKKLKLGKPRLGESTLM